MSETSYFYSRLPGYGELKRKIDSLFPSTPYDWEGDYTVKRITDEIIGLLDNNNNDPRIIISALIFAGFYQGIEYEKMWGKK